MVGAKTGEATRINEIESQNHLTHYYGHALQLAVGDLGFRVSNKHLGARGSTAPPLGWAPGVGDGESN